MSSRDRSRRRYSPSRTVRDSPIEYTSDGHRIIRRTTVTEYTIEAHPSDGRRPSSRSRDRPRSSSPRADRRSYVSRHAESSSRRSSSRSRPSRTRSPSPYADRRLSHNRHGESPARSSSRAQEYRARSRSRQDESLPTKMSVRQIRNAKRHREFLEMKRVAQGDNGRKENLKQQIVMWEKTKLQHPKATNSRVSPDEEVAQTHGRRSKSNAQRRSNQRAAEFNERRELAAAEEMQLRLLYEEDARHQQYMNTETLAYPDYQDDAHFSGEHSAQHQLPTLHHVIPAAPSPPSLSEMIQSASQPWSPPRLSLAELAAQSLTVLGKRPPGKPLAAATIPTLPTEEAKRATDNSRKRSSTDRYSESEQPNEKNMKISEPDTLVVTDVWLPAKIEVDENMPEVTSQTMPEQQAPVTDLLKAFLKQEGNSEKHPAVATRQSKSTVIGRDVISRSAHERERALHQPSSSTTRISSSTAARKPPVSLLSMPNLSLINGQVQSTGQRLRHMKPKRRSIKQTAVLSGVKQLKRAKQMLERFTNELTFYGPDWKYGHTEKHKTRGYKVKRVGELRHQISVLEGNHDVVDAITKDRERKEKKAAQLQHDLSLFMDSQDEDVSLKNPPSTSLPTPIASSPPAQLEIQRQSPPQPPSCQSSSTTTDMSTIRESIGRLLDDGLTAEELIEHMQKVGSTAKEIVTVMEVAMTRKVDKERTEKAAKKTQHLATIKNLLRETSTLLPDKS